MAKTLSKTGISTGQDILAGHVTQSVDALTGTEAYDITISGSLVTTGSVQIKGSTILEEQVAFTGVGSDSISSTGTNVLTIDGTGTIYKTGSYISDVGTNISDVYFVTETGNDATGVVGDINKPFSTIGGAVEAATDAGSTIDTLINVLPGLYEAEILNNGGYEGSFYFHPNTAISGTVGTTMFLCEDMPLKVYGYGDFYSQGSFITMNDTGVGYFECLKVTQDSNNAFCVQNGTTELTFKANKVVFNSVMTASAFTPRDGAILTTDIDELDSSNGYIDFHFKEDLGTNYTGIANVNINKWTKRSGYCWLVGNTAQNSKTFLNVDQWFITGSTIWVMAYQGDGGDNYHKFNGNIYVQVPVDSVLEDISGGGNHEIIMEGSAYVKSTPGGIPFDLNGGSNAEVTLDMWIESSGSTNVIDHSSGDLYLNKSLYNETGNGIQTTGGNLYIDTYKAIVEETSFSVVSTSPRNVTINNTFSSNVSASSDITFIGPGTYMSDQTGQLVNTSISASSFTAPQGVINQLTASYAISASVEVTKEVSSSHADVADVANGLQNNPSISITNITASNNISSSGDIFFNPTNANTGTSVLTIDPTTGKVFRTGSYSTGGSSGGGDINVGKMLYVDSVNGDDATGTGGVFNKPYLTITEALSNAEAGDIVFIRPGTYDEEQLNLSSGVSLIGENYQDVKIGPSSGTFPVLRVSTGSCYIDNVTFVPNPSDPTKPGLNISIPSNENLNIGTIGIEGDGSTGGGVGIMKNNPGTVTFESIHVLKGGLSSVIEVKNGKLSSNLNNFPSSSGAVTNFAHANNDGVKYPCIQLENLNIDTNQLTSAIKSSGGEASYVNKVTLISPSITGVTNVLDVQGNYETIESIGGEFTDVTYALSSSANGGGSDAKYRITSQHLPVYSYTPELAYNAEFAFDFLSQKSNLFKSSKNLFGVDQMSVGVAEKNIESYFGKGAPYQTGMVVFTTSGSAEKDIPSTGFFGSTGSNVTDVTTEAKSTDNSLFSFQTTGSNDTILFCTQRRSDVTNNFEPLQTFGITADILDQATSNNYVLEVHGEYIEQTFATASQWFEVPIQAYSNTLGYNYGNDIFKRNQSKETMIFGIDASVNWVTSSITPISSSGTAIPPASQQPVNGYWARFRQVDEVASLSDVPSFESFRILSDAVAIGDKGIQFQGQTIYQDVQPLGILKYDNTENTIQISLGSNPSFNTRIPDGGLVEEGITTPFTLPAGICTAYPIEIEYDVLKDSTGDDTINLKSTINEVAFNFIPTGSNKIPAQRSINNTSAVTSPQTITGSFIASASYQDKIFKITQSIDVSTLYSGDIVITNFDAVTENDVAVLNARAKFLRYALGEYRNPAQPFTRDIIPAPPITILEENWDNGSSGGTGVIDGWTLNQNVGSASAQAQSNQWRIASIGTPGDASSPVSQSLTNALYISNTTSTPTNNYSYATGDEVTCTAYCHFTPPVGVVNLQMEIHWKGRGENGYDFGTAFLALSGSDYSFEELDTREEDGTHPEGDIPTYEFASAEGFALNGDLVIANIAGGSNGRLYDTNSDWNQTTLSIDSSLYDGTNAGEKHLLCFNWFNDFTGGTQPPISIGYIKIIGSYT